MMHTLVRGGVSCGITDCTMIITDYVWEKKDPPPLMVTKSPQSYGGS